MCSLREIGCHNSRATLVVWLSRHLTVAALISVCLVLALWMTGSRPAAGSRTGTSVSDSDWDQASFALTANARRLRISGDVRAAVKEYERGLEEARRRGDKLAIVRFEMLIGG